MKRLSIAAILLLAVLAAWAWLGRSPAPRVQHEVAAVSPAAPEAAAEISPAIADLRQSVAKTPSEEVRPAAPAAASIEIRVLFDDQPLPGATVRLVHLQATPGFLIGGDVPSALAQARTEDAGLARFDRCAPGDFGVAAACAGGEARTGFDLTPDARVVRLVLPFGSAALEGEVHDLEGRAANGAIVLVRQNARTGESSAWFSARTDASGSYRLGGLAGGAGHRFVATVLDMPLGASTPFELAVGEVRHLDFGSAAGRASWAGVVRFPSGAPCAGPARLFFTATSGSTEVQGYFDAQGKFRATLPAGEYAAHLESPAGFVLGTTDVEGAVEQDLSLPKVVLRGRIRYVGEKHPIPKGPENDVLVALERDGGGKIERGPMRGASSYVFCGLEPGAYALTTSPWLVAGSADGRASIQIGPGSDEVELDLSITDP